MIVFYVALGTFAVWVAGTLAQRASLGDFGNISHPVVRNYMLLTAVAGEVCLLTAPLS